jgi:hypothetical protein
MYNREELEGVLVPPTTKLRALGAVPLAAALAGAAALIALTPAPARADWIVTRQGERFEIQGSWQQKGKLVVFTLPNGTLSSMRADRVDFDASKKATELAKKQAAPTPAAEPARPKRKAVIVLTDKDFKRTPQPGQPADAGAAGSGDAKAAAAGAAAGAAGKEPAKDVPSSVEVVSWDRVPAAESKAGGVELNGTVRNVSQDLLTELTVTALLFDENGGLIGRFPAAIENQQLPPTETSKFHLVAPGVFAFASLRWETLGRGIRGLQPAPPPPPGR